MIIDLCDIDDFRASPWRLWLLRTHIYYYESARGESAVWHKDGREAVAGNEETAYVCAPTFSSSRSVPGLRGNITKRDDVDSLQSRV